MKELIAIAPRQPILQDYEDRLLTEGQVRVKVEFGAPKRGSELTGYHAVRGSSFPMGLGNMCVGHIIELGDGVEGSLYQFSLNSVCWFTFQKRSGTIYTQSPSECIMNHRPSGTLPNLTTLHSARKA